MKNADQLALQDWNLRLLDIVAEIRASKGSEALMEEADSIESAADAIGDLADDE